MEGVSLYDLHTKDEADKYLQDDLEVINSGEANLHIEEPWETVDGLRWVSTSKIPFIDKNGEFIGIIGVSMDITDRKRADLLIEEGQFFQFDDSQVVYLDIADISKEFYASNHFAIRIFQCTDADQGSNPGDHSCGAD